MKLYGIHTVTLLLEQQAWLVKQLWLQADRQTDFATIIQLAQAHGIPIEFAQKKTFSKLLAENIVHQGIVAECKPPTIYQQSDLPQFLQNDNAWFLVLDHIQDPHNLGACMRSANAAGVTAVITTRDRSAELTATALKVSSGGALATPLIQVNNLIQTFDILKEQGVWIYGLAGEAEKNIFATDLRGKVALVLGSEGDGLKQRTKEHCDALLKIPMQGCVGSLNVSVAAGIALFSKVANSDSPQS